MKCEFCLGNLSLEDECCPNCGQPNKHAKKHIKAMKKYASKYQETENEVYATTKRYSDIVVRAIALAALVIVFVASWVANNRADDIYYAVTESKNKANYEVHKEALDQYLEKEDYVGLYFYCGRNEIIGSDAGFEDYECIIDVCWCYTDVYKELMVKVCDSEENEENAFNIDILGSALNRFYWYQNRGYDEISDEGRGRTDLFKDQINQSMEKLLMTYCNVPAEDMESLVSMSESERTVFIGECMANEE